MSESKSQVQTPTNHTPTRPEASARRLFMIDLAMILACAAAGVAALSNALRFLIPKWRRPRMVDLMVANEDEVPLGRAKEISNLAGHRILLVHTNTGYRAFSAVCTHLGCFVRYEHEKERFLCPCHMGLFDINGQVIGGPPPAPLREYEVKIANSVGYVRVEAPEA